MTGLSALLIIDTASLDAQIDVAGAHVDLSITIDNPLDLLGDAGQAIQSIASIGSGGAGGGFADALRAIEEIAPFADIAAIGEVLEIFETLRGRLQPLQELLDMDPAALVERMLDGFGGAGGIVQRLVSELTGAVAAEPPDAIAIPLAALRDLAAGAPTDPAAAAAFLARFVLGLDLGAIRAPFELLDSVREQLAGANLTALETRLIALTVEVDLASEALVSRAPDMSAVMERLGRIAAEVELVTGTFLPGALDALTADIAAIDADGLATQLDSALAPLLDRVPVPPRGLADFFLPPLRVLGDGIDDLDPAMLTAYLDELEATVRTTFANSDVGRLRDDSRMLLAGIVEFLNGLPLPALRDQLTQALAGVEEQLSSIASLSPVAALAEQMQQVTQAIDSIDLSAVTDAIGAVAGQIRGLADQFPIKAIKTELEGLLEQAEAAAARLPPLLDELKARIDELAGALTHIDLSVAGDVSVGMVSDLRGNVNEAVEGADLPDALSVPLGLLAGAVREIDLSASVSGPLDDIVARVDISGVMAPVQAALDQARAALQSLSPTALATRLDEPFDAALAELRKFTPQALIDQLSERFQGAVGELDRISPAALVAPLQAAFDDLLAKLRQAADPAPLFAPLHQAYAELQALLDAIDPTRLIGNVVAEVSKLPGVLTRATGDALGAAITGGGALPAGGGAAGPAAIKFGDMVRPFAALVNEARNVVKSSAEDLLDEALELISRPLALLSHAGQVAGGHVAAIGAAIEARRALVDPTAITGPLADLRTALARLQRIEAGLAASGRGSLELGVAVQGVQLEAFITVSFPARHDLDLAVGALDRGLGAPELGKSLHRLGQVLGDFIPPALVAPATEAAVLGKIDAIFDAVDPTPIADEMDEIGEKLRAKLESFAGAIAQKLFKIWNAIFEEIEPVTPGGILKTLSAVTDAIRAQLAVLDPARLEAEVDQVVDGVLEAFQAFSPAAFAGTLTPAFDALKGKIEALDPAVLLGDLDPLSDALDSIEALRPSVVLAPLAGQAEKIDEALQRLLHFDPAAIVAQAIANLKGQIDIVLQRIEVELDGLLGDLEGAGGGVGVSGSF
jgi:hypothetical protein